MLCDSSLGHGAEGILSIDRVSRDREGSLGVPETEGVVHTFITLMVTSIHRKFSKCH